ncbi:MAG: phenylalanine--tRNA ligase subunit beta, partial [Candidatus Magasanikbacteria bacterium]|nr:phenylalanine--tRNA ligase subunit beta [Candidatus Magasanikbacteria bacterium]
MKISLNWLKQYVDLPKGLSAQELALKLTMSTVEVEEVIDLGEQLKDLYVGQLVKITKHPDADRLFVAEVGLKKKKIQVVFGVRAEVKEGDLVPVVVAPSTLPTGIKVEKQTIRGVLSEGMLCLNSEFMVGGEDILTYFPATTKIGSQVSAVMGLDDVVLEIDNKSITHRPDLWGHYGLAREVAAIFNLKLKELKVSKIKEGSEIDLKIEILDKENCSRYLGAVMGGLKVAPSPIWLANLLKAAGVRPINNVVDVTNYVMLELGRPSHAFDRRDVSGDTIIVRRSEPGEKLKTLDGQERILSEEMCLVCDARRPIDLGGIMGGENSEIKNDTTEIILELANFNAVNIRKTALKLNLRTEAAARFEKGLDPALAELGLNRIITLLQELMPEARLFSRLVDVNYDVDLPRQIDLNLDFLNRRLGQIIPKKEVSRILESLSFSVKDKGEILEVKPPSFRTAKDISLPEDLVEEVARIYGYDQLTPRMPEVSMALQELNQERGVERKVKNILVNVCGLTETVNYSFTSSQLSGQLGFRAAGHLELLNYFSAEQKFLRVSLLENLFKNVQDNLRFYKTFDLFELGRVFLAGQGEFKVKKEGEEFLAKQDKYLGGLSVSEEVFYKIKGIVETLLKGLEVKFEWRQPKVERAKAINPAKCLEIVINDQVVGYLAELSDDLRQSLDIKQRLGYWEINFQELLKHVQDNKKYQPLP